LTLRLTERGARHCAAAAADAAAAAAAAAAVHRRSPCSPAMPCREQRSLVALKLATCILRLPLTLRKLPPYISPHCWHTSFSTHGIPRAMLRESGFRVLERLCVRWILRQRWPKALRNKLSLPNPLPRSPPPAASGSKACVLGSGLLMPPNQVRGHRCGAVPAMLADWGFGSKSKTSGCLYSLRLSTLDANIDAFTTSFPAAAPPAPLLGRRRAVSHSPFSVWHHHCTCQQRRPARSVRLLCILSCLLFHP
jgi:hypothetical protein